MTKEYKTGVIESAIFDTFAYEGMHDAIKSARGCAEDDNENPQEVEDLILANEDAIMAATKQMNQIMCTVAATIVS